MGNGGSPQRKKNALTREHALLEMLGKDGRKGTTVGQCSFKFMLSPVGLVLLVFRLIILVLAGIRLISGQSIQKK